jgi:MFS family permease
VSGEREAPSAETDQQSWYAGITGYQWLVLVIASLGWVFDVFEGQLFAVFKTPALTDVMKLDASDPQVDRMANIGLASFLIGGAVGGLLFGMLADRIGRRDTMIWSILTYSVFTALHYFAQSAWQIVGLRFFVAMGVGGEWAIAASLVAEVFPKQARAAAGGIFHASSILGVVLASVVGIALSADWRAAFLVGLAPALLILWIRTSLRESEKWQASRTAAPSRAEEQSGSLRELLFDARWRSRAWLGLGLASVGLGTYWAIYAWGPELVHDVLGDSIPLDERQKTASFAYLIMNITGGFAGLLCFAPISAVAGRRGAFAIYHIGALIMAPVTFLIATTYWQALVLLPMMAFFVVGMHAGYAIYFPELFPTRLRATGASFCFNVGRLVSAVMLLVRGELRTQFGLRYAVSLMAILFVVGLLLLWFAPETRDEELPD